MTEKTRYNIAQTARMVGLTPAQLQYAIYRGYIDGPRIVQGKRKMYSRAEVYAIADYFGTAIKEKQG